MTDEGKSVEFPDNYTYGTTGIDTPSSIRVHPLITDSNTWSEMSAIKRLEVEKQAKIHNEYDLTLARNNFASIAASRRGHLSSKNKKEFYTRYNDARNRYQTLLDAKVSGLAGQAFADTAESEERLLSEAEEVFRSGDQEAIAELFEVNHEEYRSQVQELFDNSDDDLGSIDPKLNAYNRQAVRMSEHADRLAERWSTLNTKSKLAITFGATAVAGASIAVLPIVAAGSTVAAAGGGILTTGARALKKTATYKLNSASKHKTRPAIIGKVSNTDELVELEDKTKATAEEYASNLVDSVDRTIETDQYDNRKTLRRVATVAAVGALFGGTIAKAGSWAIDKLGDIGDETSEPTTTLIPKEVPSTTVLSPEDTTPATVDEIPNETSPPEDTVPVDSIPEDTTPEVSSPEPDPVDENPQSPDEDEAPPDPVEPEPDPDEPVDESLPEEPEPPAEEPDVPPEPEEPPADLPPEPEPPAEEPVNTETPPEPEVLLHVDPGEGFQKSIKDQYGLTDDESWRAYLAIEHHLAMQQGVYIENSNYRIAAPGTLHLNPNASAALRQYLVEIEEESDEDDEEILPETT